MICLPPLPEDGVTHPGCDTGFLIARNTPRVVRLMGAVLANLQQMRKDVGGGGDAPTGLADSAVFNKAVNKTATKVRMLPVDMRSSVFHCRRNLGVRSTHLLFRFHTTCMLFTIHETNQ